MPIDPQTLLSAAMSNMRHALIAPNVLENSYDLEERKQIWKNCGIESSLVVLADLASLLDFAAETSSQHEAEIAWLRKIDSGLSWQIMDLLSKPNHGLLSQGVLVQCFKEIVQFGAEVGAAIDSDNLIRIVLGINYEHSMVPRHPSLDNITEVSKKTLWQVAEYLEGLGQEAIDSERAEWMLDEIATLAFERVDSMLVLLAESHDTWRRPWPSDTGSGAAGRSPADVFKNAFGLELDDLLAAGLLILDEARSGSVVFEHDALVRLGASPAAIAFIDKNMAADVKYLKKELGKQQSSYEVHHWLRYTLQRFTFVRLSGGQLLLFKPQFFKVRMFGGLLFWDVFSKLGGPKSSSAQQFDSAMAHVFEIRIGEELKRMAASVTDIAPPHCIHEVELREVLRTGKDTSSTCDWVVAAPSACIVVDANNRQLHQPFAERTGSVEEFRKDIGVNLVGDVPEAEGKNTKFQQLASTIAGLRRTGGIEGKFEIDPSAVFVPLVAVPDVGLPYTEFVDYEVISRARSIPELVTENVAPPALIRASEIHLLTGLVEQCRVNPFEILRQWREQVRDSAMPIGLQQFIAMVKGIPISPIDKRYVSLADRVQAQLRQKTADRRSTQV
ncbi:hypothetical protein [Nocardia cyriacigeorgica]